MESQYYVSQWEWRNRWYEAHGYFWNEDTGHWDKEGTAQFADAGILNAVLAEAGIVAHSGFGGKAWTFEELSYVGQAAVKFGQKVGGLNQLQKLLGGGVSVVRKSVPSGWESKGCGSGAVACALAWTNTAYFYDSLFTEDSLFIRGSVVHELAHLIDFKSGLGGWNQFKFSNNLPLSLQHELTEYAMRDGLRTEYWSEAIALWVYPYYKSGENVALDPLQVSYIEANLVGAP